MRLECCHFGGVLRLRFATRLMPVPQLANWIFVHQNLSHLASVRFQLAAPTARHLQTTHASIVSASAHPLNWNWLGLRGRSCWRNHWPSHRGLFSCSAVTDPNQFSGLCYPRRCRCCRDAGISDEASYPVLFYTQDGLTECSDAYRDVLGVTSRVALCRCYIIAR